MFTWKKKSVNSTTQKSEPPSEDDLFDKSKKKVSSLKQFIPSLCSLFSLHQSSASCQDLRADISTNFNVSETKHTAECTNCSHRWLQNNRMLKIVADIICGFAMHTEVSCWTPSSSLSACVAQQAGRIRAIHFALRWINSEGDKYDDNDVNWIAYGLQIRAQIDGKASLILFSSVQIYPETIS